jgi:hypothetical protein
MHFIRIKDRKHMEKSVKLLTQLNKEEKNSMKLSKFTKVE